MNRRPSALAVLLALALVVAACSDDDGDDVETGEPSPPSPTEAAESTDSTEAPGSTEAPPEPSEAPVALPASARGVTADAIKVGVAVPDFDALQAAGVGNYQGDAEIAFQAFIDVINAEGGVFGRQLDPVYVGFDFLSPETQDAACSEFVEDHEVFIVLYGLLGDSNLCLTEFNDTMVMTRSFQTTDLRERSGDTLWLQLNASDDARTRILGQTLVDSGRLDGRTVGIVTPAGDNEGFEGQVLQDTLADLGVESMLLLTEAPGNDPVQRDAELALVAERFRVAGVDFVFDLRGGGDTAAVFARSGYTPDFAFKALGATIDGAPDPAILDGAVGVGEINEQNMIEDADFQANCMDVVRAANPELTEEMAFLPTGSEQAAGQPNWVNPVMIACDQTRLLKAVGEIAGAELTNDSFRSSLDELGPFDLHGYGQASYGSESKWDGLDEFYVLEYDAATDSISVVEGPIVVER